MKQIFKFHYFAVPICLSLTTNMIADEVNNQMPHDDYSITTDSDPVEDGSVKDKMFGEENEQMTLSDCRVNSNKYTGMTQIGIPLYDTEQREVTLDVQLGYNSSGIKVNSLPSWTGYEWKLKAGGMITRAVQGKCDEMGYFFNCEALKYAERDIKLFSEEKKKWECIYYRLVELTDYSPDVFYFSFFGKSGRFFYGQDKQWHVLSESNLFIDFNVNDSANYTEPYFLYNGYDDNEIQEGLKLQFETKRRQQKTIKGFTIVDEDGTKYVFGQKNTKFERMNRSPIFNDHGACNIDYSIPLCNLHADTLSEASTMQADTWYLTEVTDRFGEVLYEFEYERGEFIVDVRPNIHTEVVRAIPDEYGKLVSTPFHLQIPDYRNLDSLRTYYSNLNETNFGLKAISPFGQKKKKPQGPYDFRVISPVYLKKINMPHSGDSIIFSRSEEREAMTSEYLYPSLYEYCGTTPLNVYLCELFDFEAKKFPFRLLQTTANSITQFHSVYSRENYLRKGEDPLYSMAIRTLKDITIYRKGVKLKKYELSYTDNGRKLISDVRIQEGNKPAGDYKFNYCNPDAIPTDVLCTLTDKWGYYAGSKDEPFSEPVPNYDSTMCGMLIAIKNPLGAVLELHYSQNQYCRYRSDDRQYFCDSEGFAGGLRVSEVTSFRDLTKLDTLSYVRYDYSDGELYSLPKYIKEHCQMTPDGNDIKIEFFNYRGVLPYQNAYGEHIGYSKVTEWYRNGVHKTFTYSNYSSHADSSALLCAGMTDAFGELDYKRGKIQKEELFDENNNLVREINYTYRTDCTETSYVLAGNLMMNSIDSKTLKMFPYVYAYYTGSIYKLFYPKYDLVETRTTTHGHGGSITDIVSYLNADCNLSIGNSRINVRKCLGRRMRRDTDQYSLLESYHYGSLSDTSFLHQFFLPKTRTERWLEKKIERSYDESNSNYPDLKARDEYGQPITDSNGHQLYIYASDIEVSQPITEIYVNTKVGFRGGEQTYYRPMVSRKGIRTMVPENEKTITYSMGENVRYSKEAEIKYLTYHGDGQPETYQEKGKPVSRVFFDKEDRIVAKVTSTAKLLDMVCNENAATLEDVITLNGVSVFKLPYTEAIVYRYNGLGLVESVTVGHGMTVHYRYDGIGRLVEERDANGRILKTYTYNISYK